MRFYELLAYFSTTLAAPLLRVEQGSTVLSGQYIIKFNQNEGAASASAFQALTQSLSMAPKFEYSLSGFQGFAGTLTESEVSKLEASEYVPLRALCLEMNYANLLLGRVCTPRRQDVLIRPCVSDPCHLGSKSYLQQATWRKHIRV